MPITLLRQSQQTMIFWGFFVGLSLLIYQYQFNFINYGEGIFHLTHSQLKLGLIFLNVKCFISKLTLSFFEVKIIYLKHLMIQTFYSVPGKCLQELRIL